MERVRLSELIEPKQNDGLNPLEIIKSLKEFAQVIKELRSMQPQQQPGFNQVESKPLMKPVAKPIQEKPKEVDTMKIDKSKGFDMILKGLKMALKFYGEDISAKEFVSKLEQDKDKILSFIRI